MDKDAFIRSFIMLEINDGVRSSLLRVQAQLKKAGARVSWVPPDNIHLSLLFLGDIFESMVSKLGRKLDEAVRDINPFDYEVEGIGTFGSVRHPRVIWAGLEAMPESLSDLYGRVKGAAGSMGIPLESRPFRPHITLGRVRAARNLDSLTSAISSVKNTRHGWVSVRRVLLMRSVLEAQGARYSILHESSLKGDSHGG